MDRVRDAVGGDRRVVGVLLLVPVVPGWRRTLLVVLVRRVRRPYPNLLNSRLFVLYGRLRACLDGDDGYWYVVVSSPTASSEKQDKRMHQNSQVVSKSVHPSSNHPRYSHSIDPFEQQAAAAGRVDAVVPLHSGYSYPLLEVVKRIVDRVNRHWDEYTSVRVFGQTAQPLGATAVVAAGVKRCG